MANPTAEWEQVGDAFYRKISLYTSVFNADLELENYVVAGAPYGGAVALIRDATKLQTYQGGRASKSKIDIYSCAGKLIRQINWDQISVIRGLGWSDDEKLLVISEDGTVRCYFDLQGDFTQFSLGHGAEEVGVHSCRFYSTGFVALLGNNSLVSVAHYEEPRPKLLATSPPGDVHSWTIIPPSYTLSRSIEVLLAVNQTIHVVDAEESEDRLLDIGPITHICVSPNGRFVALYTGEGKAYVITSDFQSRLSEHNSRAKTPPKDLQWCGNDAVVIAWEDEVHIIGPKNAAGKHYYDSRVHLIADYDGVRLLTNDVCDLLQKVPDVTDEVFRFGTESSASILLDAMEQLGKQSPRADDNLQLIRPNLVQAVDTCVKASVQEFNVHWQKQLLNAASLGKSVLDMYNSDEFVEMCTTLRVLNAVRDYNIGLPLTYAQYLRLTPQALLKRLTNRHEYLLAIRIARYLRLPSSHIYSSWASQKVRNSSDGEDNICQTIVKRLHGKHGISFEEIARSAYDEGRGRLAIALLDHEPRAGKQVPLLLLMEEVSLALDKAIESLDSDLILYVLLHLKRKLPLASFFRMISSRPLATSLIESSARYDDTELLKDLYYQDDRRMDGALVFVRDAVHQPDSRTSIDKLALASKLLGDAKDTAFTQKALVEASNLLRFQQALDRDLNPSTEPYTGLALNTTFYNLVKSGHAARGRTLLSKFPIPEAIAAHIRLRALVAARNFSEIEDLGKAKRSPIGWAPYFEALLAAGNTKLAGIFVAKCTGVTYQERVDMWAKCGMVVWAGEEAAKYRDLTLLEGLRSKAKAGEVGEIERLISGLKR